MDRSSTTLLLSLAVHALVAWALTRYDRPAPIGPESPTEVTYREPTDPPANRSTHDDSKLKLPKSTAPEDDLHDASALISSLNRRYKKQMIAARLGPDRNAAPNGPVAQREDDQPVGAPDGKAPGERGETELKLPNYGGRSRTQALFAGSSTRDRLPWVEFGDLTVLNADRSTYFAFYSRMNEQVGNRWYGLIDELVRRTPRERLLKMAMADRITRVEIILDADGDFRNVRIERGSGFEDLDYTGIEAFKMATPFVNPPKGMLGPDNLIHIHASFEVIMRPPMLEPMARPGY